MLIATDDLPCMQVYSRHGGEWCRGMLIATDDLPCMQVLITARSLFSFQAAERDHYHARALMVRAQLREAYVCVAPVL